MFDLNENLEYILSIDQVGVSLPEVDNLPDVGGANNLPEVGGAKHNDMYIFSPEDDDDDDDKNINNNNHPTNNNNNNNPIINMFKTLHQYGNKDVVNTIMPIKSGIIPKDIPSNNNNNILDDNNKNIPPSPLDSFLKHADKIQFGPNPKSKSAVLTGYQSTYGNKYYHSMLDNIDNINRKDLYKFSNTLAKALYVMSITDDLNNDEKILQTMKTIPLTLIVNETLVNDLINCTLISWHSPTCTVANEFNIGLSSDSDEDDLLLSKYVQRDESFLYTSFAREFLSKITCNDYHELPNGCDQDDCMDCVGNKCLKHSNAWYWKSVGGGGGGGAGGNKGNGNDDDDDSLLLTMEPIYNSNAYTIQIYRSDPIWLEWGWVVVGILLCMVWFFGCGKFLVVYDVVRKLD